MNLTTDIPIDALESLAHEFVVALINSDLHHDKSAELHDGLRRFVDGVHRLAEPGQPIELKFVGRHLHVANHKLIGASLQAGRLLQLMRERNLAALVFDDRLSVGSLQRFVALLQADDRRDAFAPQHVGAAFDHAGIRGVNVTLAEEPARNEPGDQAVGGYQALANNLQENHVAASHGDQLELNATASVVEQALTQMDAAPSELLSLATYDDIDSFTVGHSVRVALIAMHVAKAAGADDDVLRLVGTAGLLHDIGKSHVPQEVLFKRGKLNDDEWREMALHPRHGAEILVEQRNIHPSAISAAFCHHMAPGNRGYPRPAVAFQPSTISRLVRICDVFEALTAIRPYKRDLSALDALVIMHRQQSDFDPQLLQFFIRTMGIYPIGTRVRLHNGETALVIAQGPTFETPTARLMTYDDGSTADTNHIVMLGTNEAGGRKIEQVIQKRPVEADSKIEIASPMEHACIARRCNHDHH